jgi:hypothetical protein
LSGSEYSILLSRFAAFALLKARVLQGKGRATANILRNLFADERTSTKYVLAQTKGFTAVFINGAAK